MNKNRIPGDRKSAFVTSGIRLGTNGLALRGMGPREMPACAALLDDVLRAITPCSDRGFSLDSGTRAKVRAAVRELCTRHPLPRYPVALEDEGAGNTPSPSPRVVPAAQ